MSGRGPGRYKDGMDEAAGPGTREGLSRGEFQRATRISVISGGTGALFLTVFGNQTIFNVFLMNHLGASPRLGGLLIGLLQLTGLFQLLSIFAFAYLGRRKPFWIALHLLHRLAGFAVAAAALASAEPGARGQAARAVALALGLSWTAMNLSSSGWMSWMADLVPEEVRGSFFLKRSALFQAVTVAWFFLASLMLDLFPEGRLWAAYALIFGVGALGGAADILLHLAIPEPAARGPAGPGQGQAEARAPRGGGALPSLAEFAAPLRDRNFVRFSLAMGLGVFALLLANPFQGPYVTSPRGIGAPNVWLGTMTVISQLTWVAIAPLWGFVMDRYGRKPAVTLGCLVALSLAGYGLVTPRDYVYLLPLIALVQGFFGPAFWEGSNQLMLSLAPPARRVVYIAWYNAIVGAVSSAGPVLGGELAAALADYELALGSLRLRGFHLGQFAGLLAMGAAMLALRRVREGEGRPTAWLAGQFATASVFRSYASLGALGRDSGDPRVARALRRIEAEDGGLVMREVLARLDDPSPEVREEAARALGRIGSPGATSELAARLSDPSSAIRIEAARALGRIGDERAIPELASCMASSSPELRAACAEALGAIGGEEARSILLAALSGEEDRAVLAMGAEAFTRGADASGAEGPAELIEAVEELFARLVDARNPALERQYAIALGNLLGRPAEFYRYITGEGAARAARCRELAEDFRARVGPLLGEDTPGEDTPGEDTPGEDTPGEDTPGEGVAALERLGAALEAERGDEALGLLLALHKTLMARIFGELAAEPDFPRAAGRVDLRLGAWARIAAESGRLRREPEPGFDDRTRLLIALLGLYYLGRA